MRLPRDESGGRCSLDQSSATEGRIGRTIVAAASKDQVGTGAPGRPVKRSSTSGAIAGAGCGASLRRADEGVRPYVDVLILPDSVFAS